MNGKGRLPFEKFFVETSMPPFFAQELTFQLNLLCECVRLYRFSAHSRPFQAENQPSYVFHSPHDRPDKVAAAKVTCVMLYSTFPKVRRWLGRSDGDRMDGVGCNCVSRTLADCNRWHGWR